MNKEDLIQKWLDHNLNPTELEAFKKLEDYPSLIKLDQELAGFQSDKMDEDKAFDQVLKSIESKKRSSGKLISVLSKIAAILVIGFGIYFYTTTLDTTTSTIVSQQKTMVLPDASEVKLNAMSTLSFNEFNWNDSRDINLNGEAFLRLPKEKHLT